MICWGDSTDGGPGSWRFTELQTSFWFSCGVRDDGEVFCWDLTEYHGASYPLDSPPYRGLGVSDDQLCAVNQAGTLDCYGPKNPYLPDDHTFERVKITGTEAGCAQTDSSRLVCWGRAAKH